MMQTEDRHVECLGHLKIRLGRVLLRRKSVLRCGLVLLVALPLVRLKGNGCLSRVAPHVPESQLAFAGKARKAEVSEAEQKQKQKRAEEEAEQKRREEAAEEERKLADEIRQAEIAQKQKQKTEEEDARKELTKLEEEALQKGRKNLMRQLNRFEERRERRRVRSAFATKVNLPDLEDFRSQVKPEVKVQLDDAVRFFSETMRVPATLIASAALGTLFLPKDAMNSDSNPSPESDTLRRLYLLLTVITFCLELTAVLITSNAHAQLLELGRAGLALEPTAMDLIMSCLEFEYLACSLGFIGGVMAFMLATLCRILAVFRYSETLTEPREPQLCMAMSGMVAATLLWWVHLINVRLMEYNNIGEMIARFAQLLLARIRLGELGLMGVAALAVAFLSACCAISALVQPSQSESESVHAGKIATESSAVGSNLDLRSGKSPVA